MTAMPPPSLIERVRALCLALPEAVEVEAWGHPTFRVAEKMFCTAAADGSSISLKADPLERETLLAEGGRFHVPAYVGSKGWLGVRLDCPDIDWEEVSELIATSYCLTAPRRLEAQVTRPPTLEA
jgi:predicted DNA-binding protein (MmcQ/YjbR family)